MLVNLFFTVFFTTLVLGVVFYLCMRLKVPYFRVDSARMTRALEMAITGQANANDWNMAFSMVIRHSPELEDMRLRCVGIEEQHYIGDQKPPYLFSADGLEKLKAVLLDLRELRA